MAEAWEIHCPTGIWSQLWRGAEQYSLIEKQLAATYMALLAGEPITGGSELNVKTTYQIISWLRNLTTALWSRMAQLPMLTKWTAF